MFLYYFNPCALSIFVSYFFISLFLGKASCFLSIFIVISMNLIKQF